MRFNSQNIKITKAGFEIKCISILIEGYNLMKNGGNYSVNWEEEELTAQLIDFIEKSHIRKKWKIHIKPEIRIYTKEIIKGEVLAKSASKIDMQMLSWQNDYEEIYHIEAKNLCENNWIKDIGSEVSSSYQLNRYINAGIKHYFSNHYPSNGCMCGYILNGNNDEIISKLNVILKKKMLTVLEISEPINKHNLIYKIQNNEIRLLNIFLDFNI